MRFEPAGMTDDPDIRMSTSVMDYIFRRLALDFLSYDERADLGIFTAAERAQQVREESGEVDLTAMAASAPVEAAPAAAPKQAPRKARARAAGAGAGRLLYRAARSGAGQGRRRAAVLHLRHEDAPGR